MRPEPKQNPAAQGPALTTDLLLLPDGRILVHNLTPALSALLSELAPDDLEMQRRAHTKGTPSSTAGAARP